MLFSAPYRMFAQQPSPRIVWVDSAGRISGIVRSSETGAPVPFARVAIQPLGREVLARGDGTFRIPEVSPGSHTLLVRQIGFAPARVEVVARREPLPPMAPELLVVRVSMLPYELDTVVVVARGACTRRGFVDPDASPAVQHLLDQVSLNAEQMRTLIETYPLSSTIATRKWHVLSSGESFAIRDDTATRRSDAYASYTPGAVFSERKDTDGRSSYELVLPSFVDIGTAAFKEHHCFRFVGRDSVEGVGLYRIDFVPTADVQAPDVSGELYLDRRTLLLRFARFRLVNLPNKFNFRDVETWATFRELYPYFVAAHELEVTQRLVNVRTPDGQRLVEGRQSDRLISHRFLGAIPDAAATPDHGARLLP